MFITLGCTFVNPNKGGIKIDLPNKLQLSQKSSSIIKFGYNFLLRAYNSLTYNYDLRLWEGVDKYQKFENGCSMGLHIM